MQEISSSAEASEYEASGCKALTWWKQVCSIVHFTRLLMIPFDGSFDLGQICCFAMLKDTWSRFLFDTSLPCPHNRCHAVWIEMTSSAWIWQPWMPVQPVAWIGHTAHLRSWSQGMSYCSIAAVHCLLHTSEHHIAFVCMLKLT